MIRPNELTNPGERAAYARVEALFASLDELSALDLTMVPPSALDDDERRRLLAEVEGLAGRSGRSELLANALGHGRESVLARFVAEFRGRAGGASRSYDPRSEATAVRAISDAIAVAVVEDQLPTGDAEALAGPMRALFSLEPAVMAPPAGLDGAPTEQDWADADHGMTIIDPDAPIAGFGARRTGLIVAALVIGIPTALLLGFRSGGPALAAAAGALVAVLAWSFASSGRR
jgi:hypothetical protein